MRNREKFCEVFGFTPDVDAECIAPKVECDIHKNNCSECPYSNWFFKEYNEEEIQRKHLSKMIRPGD